jgi:SAM-dependent methyltransferase
MFEVIEHVEDPLSVMREVSDLLKPGGMLALSTPNCDCPEALGNRAVNVWFIPPEHISYFGPRTIRDCLKRVSLDILEIDALEGVWRALAGDTSFPPWLTRFLRMWRKNKRRLRPGGFIGKILKRAYSPGARPQLYQRRHPADLGRAEVLEIYARKC